MLRLRQICAAYGKDLEGRQKKKVLEGVKGNFRCLLKCDEKICIKISTVD